MEKTEFVERRNADLGTEFQSIVQYVQHVATIKGAEYRSIAEELGNHLGQELEHAKVLARQIDFLGGTPAVQVPPVPNSPRGGSPAGGPGARRMPAAALPGPGSRSRRA